jgi:hypothetical protein
VIKLVETCKSWGTTAFDDTFKEEVGKLQNSQLPLQQGLTQSSYVSDSDLNVVILSTSESSEIMRIKTGVFYAGIIAGSCCADDPTPLDEITEYCELQFEINRSTAETEIILLTDGLP